MPGLHAQITYTVSGRDMEIVAQYQGGENRPQLSLFGLRFETPVPLDEVAWIGLSGETYPDRKKGGFFGTHIEVPHIPPYLVPQECGCHMDTCQTTLHLGKHRLTLEKVNTPYAFSAIPYTPWQLCEAKHSDELPSPCRTVVTLCGAMRGVGGINSWGADVEEEYQVPSNRDHTLRLRILL